VFEVLGLAGILFAAVSLYFQCNAQEREAEDQREETQYRAWQLINTAQEDPGSGGRIQALENLHGDGVLLDGVGLSHAWLVGVKLDGGSLEHADLRHANLSFSSLKAALLGNARLDSAVLSGAHLEGAKLWDASMRGCQLGIGPPMRRSTREVAFHGPAKLQGADLSGADLTTAAMVGVDLKQTVLFQVNFTGANLAMANLERADVASTDFECANLVGSNLDGLQHWRDIEKLELANLYGVYNPPAGFLEWALDAMGAVQIDSDSTWRFMLDSLGRGDFAKALAPRYKVVQERMSE